LNDIFNKFLNLKKAALKKVQPFVIYDSSKYSASIEEKTLQTGMPIAA